MTAYIRTVLGDMDPQDLGTTLMHEHLIWDLTCYFEPPPQATKRKLGGEKVNILNLGDLRWNPFAVKDNLLQDDVELACEEVKRYKWAGGNSIVDVTCGGMGRDVLALKRIALETGVTIITASGYYIDLFHPDSLREKPIDQIRDEIIEEIENGIEGTDVRGGVIGEIGTSQILTESEEKVLRAAGQAQLKTGLPLYVHPYVRERKPFALGLLDILEEEGVEPSRVIICHMDTNPTFEYHKQVAQRGAYISYDTFGKEYTRAELSYEFPKDSHRAKLIDQMIQAGFVDNILISQDVCLKMDLRRFGGWGYDHILTDVVPIFRQAGLGNDIMIKLMKDNPRKALTINRR